MRSKALEYAIPQVDRMNRSGFQILCATVCALSIGIAIQLHDGEYTPGAIILVTVAILFSVIPFGLSNFGKKTQFREKEFPTLVLIASIAIEFVLLFFTWPAGVDQQVVTSANHVMYLVRLAVAAMLIILGISGIDFLRSWWFPLLLLAHLSLGIWMIRSSPDPHIDVWVFEQQGPDALLHGRNPYVAEQVKFPDIYHSTRPGAQEVYGPGMSKDDLLHFGFPYPPTSLLLSTMGYKFFGDNRYTQVIALALAGLFIGYSRPGLIAKLAAALLLFTPRVFFILGRAWTEPLVVMLLAATIFCACRKSKWLPLALGLFLASKQYLIFAAPLTFLLLPEPFEFRSRESWMRWLRLLLVAGLVAALITLPLALWDFRAFWFSLFTVQKKAPFRWDALSYLVFIGFRNSAWIPGVWVALLAAIFAIALGAWKAPRNAGGFGLALGLTYVAFFAFNKQAFCNYYFFTSGAFCCAIAALSKCNSPRRHGDTEARSSAHAA
jgi:hypothetical protein